MSQFFGVLKKFNNNTPINITLKNQIEKHFKYKWEIDKNQAFESDKDKDIFDQIPEEIQDCIFYKFLYSKFLRDFHKFFECEKRFTKIKYNFYTWDD